MSNCVIISIFSRKNLYGFIFKRDPGTQVLINMVLEHRLGKHKKLDISSSTSVPAREKDVLTHGFCGEQSLNPFVLMPNSFCFFIFPSAHRTSSKLDHSVDYIENHVE